MHGSTHLAGGLLAGVLVQQAVGISAEIPGALVPLGLASVAALVPDWVQINLPGLNNIVRGVAGHRGASHWLLTALIVGVSSIIILPGGGGLYLAVGWGSHVALDLFAGGMAFLWPWPGRISLGNIKTGGKLDHVIGGALLALAVLIFVGRFA